jgi:AbiU2
MKSPVSSNLKTPEQQLALVDAKIDRLVNEVAHVSALNELNIHFNYSRQIIVKVNHSFASTAFVRLQNEILSAQILAVCRIWDSSGSDRCSFSSIIERSSNRKFQEDFDRIKLPSFVNKNQLTSQERWRQLGELSSEVNVIQNGLMLHRTRAHRDEFLAHALLKYQLPVKGDAQLRALQYGDETELFHEAQKLATRLFALLKDGHVNFEVYSDMHQSEARPFADSIRFQSRKEYNIEKIETKNA